MIKNMDFHEKYNMKLGDITKNVSHLEGVNRACTIFPH